MESLTLTCFVRSHIFALYLFANNLLSMVSKCTYSSSTYTFKLCAYGVEQASVCNSCEEAYKIHFPALILLAITEIWPLTSLLLWQLGHRCSLEMRWYKNLSRLDSYADIFCLFIFLSMSSTITLLDVGINALWMFCDYQWKNYLDLLFHTIKIKVKSQNILLLLTVLYSLWISPINY